MAAEKGNRKRYAQVGNGGRSKMYHKAVAKEFADFSVMVGLCDDNAGRLELARQTIRELSGEDVATYPAERFDDMIADTKPDTVIVTTRDCCHHHYICRAMELGCNVVTEKPMTTDAAKCRQIIDIQRKTGKTCTVTFNYRYAPPRTQVKDLLMQGVIGEVLSVDFHWMLDLHHGTDYFRRWHRNKANSGGLMVHKATHHFDLVNWWLSSVPKRVFASGHRHFYLPATADRYGLTSRSDRCHTCPEQGRCPFALKMKDNAELKSLYLENEEHDGYIRDKCVFGADIDIEDSMNVLVDYANGAKLTYSLNAFCPWEGYLITFNGSRGRLEHKCEEKVYINGDGTVPGALQKEGTWTHIYPNWQPAYGVDLWSGEGGHGGADPVMLKYIFDPSNQPADPYMRAADQRSGAYSILCGIAANTAMASDQPVLIDDLVTNIGMPDYPPMPAPSAPLPLQHLDATAKRR